MLLFAFTSLVGLAASLPSSSHAHAARAAGDLIVTKVPDYVRPYIVRAYALEGYRVGSQIYRFPVTGPSSDYAFTLISTAAPASTSLGVLPHVSHCHIWHNDPRADSSRPMRPITRTSTASKVVMLSGQARTMSPPAGSSHPVTTALSPTIQPTLSSFSIRSSSS
jgi:hypothetical protein